MDSGAYGARQKPATAARMYDYYLGGVHNFPADRQAAREIMARFPHVPCGARANRAFLGRAVRYLTASGIRQFLDLGSGIPTVGNVHEIAQRGAPNARVVYVDIDPVAVGESLDLLEGNSGATAIRADLRCPRDILDHPGVRRLLDLTAPVGVLLAAVLHFLPDDAEAYGMVAELLAALPSGSYLVLSHAAIESFPPNANDTDIAGDIYRRQTTTPSKLRTRSEVERFFAGTTLLDPGVVWLSRWRADQAEQGAPIPAESSAPAEDAGMFADDPQWAAQAQALADDPSLSCGWAGVGKKN